MNENLSTLPYFLFGPDDFNGIHADITFSKRGDQQ
jgi:hypothetical protein